MLAVKHFPPLPEIGRPDAFYTTAIAKAESQGYTHLRASLKVARYISLGLSPELSWDDKAKYFLHALRHHCTPPSADEETQTYYDQLAELVRRHAGAEALREASQEDDMYAARAALGQDRSLIEDDAEAFFLKVMGQGDHRPDLFNEEDWAQLKLLRDQWI